MRIRPRSSTVAVYVTELSALQDVGIYKLSHSTPDQLLGCLSQAIRELCNSGEPEMPMTWGLLLLAVARRPGCTSAWLSGEIGSSISVVNRILQDLGAINRQGQPGLALLEHVDDPLHRKRKLYFLSGKGRKQIEAALTALQGAKVTYSGRPIEVFRDALAEHSDPPMVRTDHFTPQQVAKVKAAATRRFSDFVGNYVVVLPLGPVRGSPSSRDGQGDRLLAEISDWVQQHGGRWYELEDLYSAEGGTGLADFDDQTEQFYFVVTWRGAHS